MKQHHQKKKKRKRKKLWAPFFRTVMEVLGARFSPALRSQVPDALGPKDPTAPELYVSRKPFSPEHRPPSLVEAQRWLDWNERRVADWRRRGGTAIWERIAEQVRNGTYDAHAHTYEGRVESVMGSAARELMFLQRWIRRSARKPPQEWLRRRRRPHGEHDPQQRQFGGKDGWPRQKGKPAGRRYRRDPRGARAWNSR